MDYIIRYEYFDIDFECVFFKVGIIFGYLFLGWVNFICEKVMEYFVFYMLEVIEWVWEVFGFFMSEYGYNIF